MEYVLPGAKLTAVGLVSSAYSHELWMSWSLTSSVFFPCSVTMSLKNEFNEISCTHYYSAHHLLKTFYRNLVLLWMKFP